MLKIVRITFSIIALLLATLGLLTHNALFLPYTFLSLGLMCFFAGIAELQERRQLSGILLFLAGAFALYIPLWEFFR
ncbi:YczI family protein [Bacillus cereus]|uniref:YczI family protein n=1 Tax=Bacillus TaxID=1386 RepID=UPI000557EB1E|nr:YczI family protein [Bacillus sp. UNC322MFChir4.1]